MTRLLVIALETVVLLWSMSVASGSTLSVLSTEDFASPPLANAANPLITPTYDGSGQIVHPDILYFPSGWHGWEYWLVVTPYPGGDASKENPSILVSHDGARWQNPSGITNPIVLPQTSHLADGDLFYDQRSHQLWVFYVHQHINGHTYLMRKISSDGVHWGSQTEDPGQALFNVTDYELLSPAVLKIGTTYWMWSVSLGSRSSRSAASKVQYRTSADGINWSSPLDAHLTQDGYIPWHVDVIQVVPRNEFWMLFCAFPLDSRSNNTVLFFAKSTDGINWTTYGRAALPKGTGLAWDRGQIYRSTLLYDADHDLLKVWYSANDGSAWHLGFTQSNYTKFLNRLVAQAANGITSPKSDAMKAAAETFVALAIAAIKAAAGAAGNSSGTGSAIPGTAGVPPAGGPGVNPLTWGLSQAGR